MSIILALSGPAQAFCGAYVGSADSELSNSDSRIVIARSGFETRLTMFNDVSVTEDMGEFGMVVPVPAALDQRHVRLVDEQAMTTVERYARTSLRRVHLRELLHPGPRAPGFGASHARHRLHGLRPRALLAGHRRASLGGHGQRGWWWRRSSCWASTPSSCSRPRAQRGCRAGWTGRLHGSGLHLGGSAELHR